MQQLMCKIAWSKVSSFFCPSQGTNSCPLRTGMSPGQPGVGLQVKELWCCLWKRAPSGHHSPSALCGATSERGCKQGCPGMNLGPQPSPKPRLMHLRVGLHPLDCAGSKSGAEAAGQGHSPAAPLGHGETRSPNRAQSEFRSLEQL